MNAIDLRDEMERERDADIDAERKHIHDLLADIKADAAKIQRALTRLGDGPGNLYDVEIADSPVPSAALSQIAVGVAALTGVVPKPEF